MRLKSLILIASAVLIAGGTAYIARGWLAAERAAILAQKPKPQPVTATQVLVAAVDLPMGRFVRAEHLRWQPWPADSIAGEYIVQGTRKLDDLVGTVARQPIAAGEPVTDGRVVRPGDSGFLAAVLQPGMRAVSVPVTVTSGISGFVFPGDRVDLILTHTVPQEEGDGARYASETVLRNVRVLAIDQTIAVEPEQAQVARTATFEVTSKQSEIIAVAIEVGKLSLALRSLAREEPEGATLIGSSDQPAPKPRRVTYTLDSEASRLLPPQMRAMPKRRITVMRAEKAEEMRVE